MRAAHYTKIGDAGVRRRGLWNSLGSLRPTLRDRQDDAKFNVAEIDAVNMGEIGAVRKRSRQETGPHDSSPCVARVKIQVGPSANSALISYHLLRL